MNVATPGTRKFDCIRFVREARARIHEETKHMSAEEFTQWLHSRRPTNPKLAALKDRMVPSKGGRAPTPPSGQ